MEWIARATGNAALISAFVATLAAGLVVWRTGSIHPVYTRLLRLFISREEVEDSVVRQSLADQAAVVSFRMAHGVEVETLADTRKLIAFGNSMNIPLYLIGRAGATFDVKTLSMITKRVPAIWLVSLPAIGALALWFLICMFSIVASSDRLLVTLKETQTSVFISSTEARAAWPQFFGERGEMSLSSCNSGSANPTPNGFAERDREILCGVWGDPALKAHLEREIPKQRKISIATIAILFVALILIAAVLRHWLAAIKLNRLLSPSARTQLSGGAVDKEEDLGP